jgi:hypothetical protein
VSATVLKTLTQATTGAIAATGFVASNGARWNDKRNGMLPLHPAQSGRWRRPAETAPWGRRTPQRHPTERQQLHRPNQRGAKGSIRTPRRILQARCPGPA